MSTLAVAICLHVQIFINNNSDVAEIRPETGLFQNPI